MSIEAPTPGQPDAAELGAAVPQKARRRSLWFHADFMKLWTAQTISQLGDEVTELAIPLIAILILGAGPFEMGVLGTLLFLPFILFTLPAGVWVDRLRRRPLMIAANLGRAVLLLSIPLAFALDVLTLWQLFVIAFAVGALQVFFDVAYQSYLPAVVERDQLVEGNAKLEISQAASSLPGPGIAGFLIAIVSAPFAIVVDAISFLASAGLLGFIRRDEPTPERTVDAATGKRTGMRTEIADGLRYVLGNRYLRSIAACTGTFNLFGNIAGVLLLLYAVNQLGLRAEQIGIAFAIGNVGTLAAAFSSERIGRRIGVGPTIVASAAVGAIPMAIIGLAPPEAAFGWLIGAFAIQSFTNVVYNVNQVSLRQAITPTWMQGRMNATMRFIVWGTIPIGALIGGVLGEVIGIRPTIWVAAVGIGLAFLPVLLSPVRTLQRIPEAAA